MTTPTDFTWQNLYELAREIGECAPWSCMNSSDFFSIPNPEWDDIAFVHAWGDEEDDTSVLQLFPSERSFARALLIMNSDEPDNLQPMCHVPALYLAFEPSRDIAPEERRWMKAQGIFQKCSAGYPHLTHTAPRLALHIVSDEPTGEWAFSLLRQVLEVCRAARERNDAPWDREEMIEADFLPLLNGWDEKGQPLWTKWPMKPELFHAPDEEEEEPPPLDFAAAAKLQKLKRKKRTLRMALMLNPTPAHKEGARRERSQTVRPFDHTCRKLSRSRGRRGGTPSPGSGENTPYPC